MALIDTTWYVDFGNGTTTGFYSVTKWAATHAYSVGNIMRANTAPAVGSERVFVCTTAGTSNTTTEPTWVVTRGGATVDNTAHWNECTGQPALNGDTTNATQWAASTTWVLGQVIYVPSNGSVQICTAAGAGGTGSIPAFSASAGTPTTDASATWQSLGLASAFTSWETPHARLANAFAANWGAAGNQFFLASEHAETEAAAMTLTSPGTVALPCFVYCVTKTAVPPTSANISTGATISTTGTSSISFGAGYTNFVASGLPGIAFQCGSAATNGSINFGSATGSSIIFQNCTFKINNTSAASVFGLATVSGSAIVYLRFYGCSFLFGATAQSMAIGPSSVIDLKIIGGSFCASGSVPTNVFIGAATGYMEGVDLSKINTVIVESQALSGDMLFKDCFSNATVNVVTLPTLPAVYTQKIDWIRSDSANTNYRSERYWYQGQLKTSNTIYRAGGATDNITPTSWQVNGSAHNMWAFPFETFPVATFNGTILTNRNVTMYGLSNTASLPNNDQFWFDIEYCGSNTSPLGTYIFGSKTTNIGTNTALTADTSDWDNGVGHYATSKAYTAYTGTINATSVMTVGTGQVWFCTVSGTSNTVVANTSFTGASDGATVIDGTATFKSAYRFSYTQTLSSPQPQQYGYLYSYPKVALPSFTFIIDPVIYLS